MSTKTTFKRVALVAVSALGIGLLSAIPSQATVTGALTVTATNGTATLQKSDSTSAGTVSVKFFTDNTADTATITLTLGTKPSGAVGGTDSILVTGGDTASATGAVSTLRYFHLNDSTTAGRFTAVDTALATPFGTDSYTATYAVKVTAGGQGNAFGKIKYFLDSNLVRTVGTYTVDYLVRVYPGGALDSTKSVAGSVTITVTDGTAAAAGSVSAAGTSTAVMYGAGTYVNTGSVDSVVSAVNTPKTGSGEAVAVIRVTQKTADGSPSRESITVTTNIGNVGRSDGTSLGKNVTLIGSASGVDDIGIFGDGTSGVATITIKTTSVTFSSKQVTFYSTTVDKYVVTVLGSVIGSSTANALLVKTYDALGNLIVNDTSAYAYSDNLDVISTGATTATGTACAYVTAYAGQICQLSGSANGTANITIRNKSTSALSTVSSTAVKLTVNTNTAAKVSLAFDKATYAPGEAAYIRVVAVDAAGTNVGPNSAYTNLLATGGITSSLAFGNGSDTTTASAVNLKYTTASGDGYASNVAIGLYKVYMPYTGGKVTITATGGTALPAAAQVAVTASADVTDSGASALAAVTALASQVSAFITKINAQITTLTDLVMKIQKKVKA